MTTSNRTVFPIATVIAFAALFTLGGCGGECPPVPPCPAPNPLISRQESGFSVTPGTSISGAIRVIIVSTDAQNQPLDTDTIAPTATQFYQYGPSAIRPIQLRFTYLDSIGQKLAGDELRIDDSEINSGGITALDIVVGLTPPEPPVSTGTDCPSMASQPIATGTGSVNFSWVPTDWFKVIVAHNNVTKTFILNSKAASGGVGAGSVTLYGTSDVFNCLNNPAVTLSEDEKSGFVETSSTTVTCTVTGTDNNDNQTPRRITIVGPSGCNIAVMKK